MCDSLDGSCLTGCNDGELGAPEDYWYTGAWSGYGCQIGGYSCVVIKNKSISSSRLWSVWNIIFTCKSNLTRATPTLNWLDELVAVLVYRCRLVSIGIPIIQIRQSHGRVIFVMEFYITVKTVSILRLRAVWLDVLVYRKRCIRKDRHSGSENFFKSQCRKCHWRFSWTTFGSWTLCICKWRHQCKPSLVAGEPGRQLRGNKCQPYK